MPAEVSELVLRLARENPSWGYQLITSEVRRLGYRVSRASVHKSPAAPGHPTLSVAIPAQMASVPSGTGEHHGSLDFFTVDTIGFARAYVPFFIELASRQIIQVSITEHPTVLG